MRMKYLVATLLSAAAPSMVSAQTVTLNFSGTFDEQNSFGPSGSSLASQFGSGNQAFTGTMVFNTSAPNVYNPPFPQNYNIGEYAPISGSLLVNGYSYDISDWHLGLGATDWDGYGSSAFVSIVNGADPFGSTGEYVGSHAGNEILMFNMRQTLASLTTSDLGQIGTLSPVSTSQLGNYSSVAMFDTSITSSGNLGSTSPFTSFSFVSSGGGLGAGALPEPSTWAMMILGIGAAGYSLRRRRVSYSPSIVRGVV